MKDVIHSTLKIVDHERYKITGAVISVLLMVGLMSCGIKIQSPITGAKVDRTTFKMELVDLDVTLETERLLIEQQLAAYNMKVAARNTKADAGDEEFVKAETFQEAVFTTVTGFATTIASGGAVGTPAIVSGFITLGALGVGGGAIAEAVRKNKVIKEEKAKNNNA